MTDIDTTTDKTPAPQPDTNMVNRIAAVAVTRAIEAFQVAPYAEIATALVAEIPSLGTPIEEAAALVKAVAERIGHARFHTAWGDEPEPTGLAWSGYDDDESWFPLFTSREAAQLFAAEQFRISCLALGNAPADIGEITFEERREYTKAHDGHPGMFDLNADIGGDGWVVCTLPVYDTAAAALAKNAADAKALDEPRQQP